jgi:hypothetical protein
VAARRKPGLPFLFTRVITVVATAVLLVGIWAGVAASGRNGSPGEAVPPAEAPITSAAPAPGSAPAPSASDSTSAPATAQPAAPAPPPARPVQQSRRSRGS